MITDTVFKDTTVLILMHSIWKSGDSDVTYTTDSGSLFHRATAMWLKLVRAQVENEEWLVTNEKTEISEKDRGDALWSLNFTFVTIR